MGRAVIASVFAVACAVLHEDVVRAGSHQAESLIAFDSWFAHVSTAAEVAPDTVH